MLATETSFPTLLRFLTCPHDQGELSYNGTSLRCVSCQRAYAVENDIPVFLTAEDAADQKKRGTELFEGTPEYFIRLHTKRVEEWRTIPYLSETYSPAESWALDVGCGAGTMCLSSAKRGLSSIGMDISIHGARVGRDLARKMGLTNCFFVVGDAVHLPFRTGSFRLVTNYTAIEHVYDHVHCLAEMHRVTAAGGRMLVNTINNFAWRPENGVLKAILMLAHETLDYLRSGLGRWPVAPPHGADTTTITRRRWHSGEEMDLYHARSYDLVNKVRRLFHIELYTTHSYPRDGKRRVYAKDLSIREESFSFTKRALYQLLHFCNLLPLLKEAGRTITVIGRKRG